MSQLAHQDRFLGPEFSMRKMIDIPAANNFILQFKKMAMTTSNSINVNAEAGSHRWKTRPLHRINLFSF